MIKLTYTSPLRLIPNRLKNIWLFIAIVNFTGNSFAFSTEEKTASLYKVWGLMKYNHPIIAKGEIDWDKEFMDHIDLIEGAKNQQQLSSVYINWILTYGKTKICKRCNDEVANGFNSNLNWAWIDNRTLFSDSLILLLHLIRENRNQGDNFYVHSDFNGLKFTNEKIYADSVFPSRKLRLLSLARYWNMINYFYPYKYLIGKDWDKVLDESIPVFSSARDTLEYNLGMLQLIVKINDGHATFVSHYTNQYFGIFWTPFSFKIIDNRVVVNHFYNDSLARIDDIHIGDVISRVNGRSVEDIIKEQSKYIVASNESARLNNFYTLLNGNTDAVQISYTREGNVYSKTVHRYRFKNFNFHGWNTNEICKVIDGNIGYVDLGGLMPDNVKEAMSKMWETKAIVFDARSYPHSTMFLISEYLNSKPMVYAKFTDPCLKYPGMYQTRLESCGRKNSHPFKGKVVLLFNENTQSQGECTCMGIQTAGNVTCIGSQTAGADGAVSEIILPGGYKTYITVIGVYYPDGRETQRIGLKPEIEVHPTIEGIQNKKDEVLDRAIQYIKSGL